ncbi:MAG: hypothetical protein A2W99_13530 [Bacteroidetes bacterium GWF2_33_16]|nr:MAG: hypothetical protein A2X00_08185 [Bacteroidetes bacterium GWE2_32_14]OFY06696.1 MAG: hypothetical protein A2W99_13530 [Bacteroidetes bacterium GWF2_33_16]
MFALIEVSPILSKLVVLSLLIILSAFIFKLFKLPSIISYILVGLLIGPFGFELITDETLISNFGDLGLVLLLFFIGMEIPIDSLVSRWKVSFFGTLLQIGFSIAAISIISLLFNWELKQIIIFGFVISLSSTAVILKVLEDYNQTQSKIGKNVIAILIAQDIIIVPMLIVINYLGGERPEKHEIIKQVIGAILLLFMLLYIFSKRKVRIPFGNFVFRDREMQVFVAFSLCFGFATLSAFFNFSSALGAFVAGLFVSAAKATKWVHDSLHAFRTMFVALFFVSIGLLLDINFLRENLLTILVLCLIILFFNNLINTFIFRIFKEKWNQSIYSGALLAQIGEFSFILGATAYYTGIIDTYTYQIILSTISLSLFISPFWIFTARKLLKC